MDFQDLKEYMSAKFSNIAKNWPRGLEKVLQAVVFHIHLKPVKFPQLPMQALSETRSEESRALVGLGVTPHHWTLEEDYNIKMRKQSLDSGKKLTSADKVDLRLKPKGRLINFLAPRDIKSQPARWPIKSFKGKLYRLFADNGGHFLRRLFVCKVIPSYLALFLYPEIGQNSDYQVWPRQWEIFYKFKKILREEAQKKPVEIQVGLLVVLSVYFINTYYSRTRMQTLLADL